MNDLTLKYSLLDKSSKKEVNDFIDFLLNRVKQNKMKKNSDYKKKILSISVWTDEDVSILQSSRNNFNDWKIEEW